MIDNQLNARSRRDRFGTKINRDHWPVLAYGLPWLSIMFASMVPMLPFLPQGPLVPPLGFLVLLGWRFVRPGLLPLWAGLPLGAFDDLLSGQPLGSAILLWSASLLAIEALEARFPWRGFVQDWFVASLLILGYLFFSALFAAAIPGFGFLPYLLPQLLLSALLFPIIAKIIAALDRIRLLRVKRIG